jgi:LSD1 subclass zinc finger protein
MGLQRAPRPPGGCQGRTALAPSVCVLLEEGKGSWNQSRQPAILYERMANKPPLVTNPEMPAALAKARTRSESDPELRLVPRNATHCPACFARLHPLPRGESSLRCSCGQTLHFAPPKANG